MAAGAAQGERGRLQRDGPGVNGRKTRREAGSITNTMIRIGRTAVATITVCNPGDVTSATPTTASAKFSTLTTTVVQTLHRFSTRNPAAATRPTMANTTPLGRYATGLASLASPYPNRMHCLPRAPPGHSFERLRRSADPNVPASSHPSVPHWWLTSEPDHQVAGQISRQERRVSSRPAVSRPPVAAYRAPAPGGG